jgi:hypothetical protein
MIAWAPRLLVGVVLTGATLLPAAGSEAATPANADPASSLSRAFPLGRRPLCCRQRPAPATTPTTTAAAASRVAPRHRGPDRPGTIIALIVVGLPIGAGVVAAAAMRGARAQPAQPQGLTTLVADRCGQLVEVAQRPLRGQSGERLLWVVLAVDLRTGTAWTGLAQATRGDRPALGDVSAVLREVTLDLYMGGHRLEAVLVDDPAAIANRLRWRLGVRDLRILPREDLDGALSRTGPMFEALGSALGGHRISATAPGAVEEQLQLWTEEHNAALAAAPS